ncbi:MAG: FG-GAP repeat protein, partial [Planctomycetes bacterium]|nr:FG-GAP repeat protein [Planctomycetota bacterium]
ATFESFGYSVAVSGDTALVGACCIFASPTYVFSFDPRTGRWIETQLLSPSDLQAGEYSGGAVAIDGDVALVAAGHVHEDDAGVFYGAVFVFRYNGSLWVEEDELLASDSAWQDGFGASVSISGDLAVIGALLDDDNGANSGSAYIFRYDGSNWVEEQKLLASDGAAGNFFGTAVGIDGDTAVIGADGPTSGSAYVFRFDAQTSRWIEDQKLVASDGPGHEFGVSVSISADATLIGARLDDENGSNAGSAYLFRFEPDTSQWVEEQKLLASDGAAGDQFGRSVAIDGDIAVIGAWAGDANGPYTGPAYVFRYRGSRWVEQQQLLPEPNPWTPFFGWSVAVSGDTVVIGAHGEDHQAGAVYVFDLAACLCPADLDADDSVGILDLLALLAAWGSNPGGPPDFDGDGTVGILDLLILLAAWGACP